MFEKRTVEFETLAREEGTLVASVVAGLLAGRWVDATLGTKPCLFIIGAFLGIILGLYYFFCHTAKMIERVF